MSRFSAVVLAGILLPAGAPFVARAAPVHEIRVVNLGEAPVDEQSVLAYTSLRVGAEFSRAAVSRDIKALQHSQRFSFVAAKADSVPEGVIVIYEVKARPRLAALTVKGSDYLDAKKITKLLVLAPGDPVDDALLAMAAQKVTAEYRKNYYPGAVITWDITEHPERGSADVLLTVQEGPRAKIRKISFAGNKSLTTRALKKAMRQRKINLFSFLNKTGRYSPDELEVDRETLRILYLDQGYLDAKIGDAQVETLGKDGVTIQIPIHEGSAYTIRDVTVQGISLFREEAINSQVLLRPGAPASLAEIEKSAQAVKDYYGARGYIRTYVSEDLQAHPDSSTVDIAYKVQEGKLAYIRTVRVTGNHKTKDKVIRREAVVYPGEVYNEPKVRRSERRIYNLGYFASVHALPEETPDPDQYDVNFEVEEKKTGQFIVGAGFSSVDNLIGFVELSQGNFDIKGWPHFTGAGQKLKLRAQLGTSRTDAEISFTEPWFLDRRLSLGASLFSHDRRFLSDDYDQRNTGGRISLGKPIGGFNRVNLSYTLENIEVRNVDTNASATIQAEEGERLKSAVTAELAHDSRDKVFVPTRGLKASLAATLAGGPLGAETDLYEFQGSLSRFWPIWFDHVFSLRASAGVVEEYGDADGVPIFDRLFLGGARTLRGFEFRDVGPKDEDGEPIGGQSSWFGSAEYTIPVGSHVRFATFYDIGMVDAEPYTFEFGDYNSDWGIGVRFDIPQFPLHLDYAWPLETDEFNDRSSGRFNFLLGYLF